MSANSITPATCEILAPSAAESVSGRESDEYTVSVYRKAATARPDEFIGPTSVAVPWTNVHYTA